MNMKTIFLTTLILLSFVAGSAIAAAPAAPASLTNTTGAGWVQWNWVAGTPTDNVTDTYNFSITCESTTTWTNGTAVTYKKVPDSPTWESYAGKGVTIYVYAFNTTYSELSTGVTDTVTVPMMFSSVVNLIAAIVPLFASILDLIIAVFPLVIAMAFLAGLAILINKIFEKSLNFGGKK